jgi:integrase/recombinase XerD
MTALRKRMLEDLSIRNYAPTTVACYVRSVAEFAQHFNKPPDQLGPEEIRAWQLFLLNEKRVKLSTYIQAVCALRFFYQNTLHRRIEIDRIPLPRYEKKLPVILSKAEVKALLEAPKNLKHRALLATMYGAGLRVSEVAKLKVHDLDRERHVIWVRGGKGHKDRQVMLAGPLREVLAAYWRWKRPTNWLFPGRNTDCPIATVSVFRACAKAARMAGISKPIHPHSLRHAFATPSAGRRCEPAGDSGLAGPRAPENHGPLSAPLRQRRSFHEKPARNARLTRSGPGCEHRPTATMREHRLEVADVFRTYQKEFFAQWGHVLGPRQRKAFEAIRDCRTAALGGHVEYVEQCDTCGHRVISYNSCLMESNSLWRV